MRKRTRYVLLYGEIAQESSAEVCLSATDDILDAWHRVERALKNLCPEDKDSLVQINKLQGKLSGVDLRIAHDLRRQRNALVHERKPIASSAAFISEANRIADLIEGKTGAAKISIWWWVGGAVIAFMLTQGSMTPEREKGITAIIVCVAVWLVFRYWRKIF